MAHFAEIDENNIVTRVLVIADDQEHRGQQFLADDLGLGGTWIQTSYNGTIRKNFAGVGYKYDADKDAFIAPQPHPSWSLDSECKWVAPVACPADGKLYQWDEQSTSWVFV